MISLWWLVASGVVVVFLCVLCLKKAADAFHLECEVSRLEHTLRERDRQRLLEQDGQLPVNDKLLRSVLTLCELIEWWSDDVSADRLTVNQVAELLTAVSTRFIELDDQLKQRDSQQRILGQQVMLDRSSLLRDVTTIVGNSQETVAQSVRSLQDALRDLVTLSSDMERFKLMVTEQHALAVGGPDVP